MTAKKTMPARPAEIRTALATTRTVPAQDRRSILVTHGIEVLHVLPLDRISASIDPP